MPIQPLGDSISAPWYTSTGGTLPSGFYLGMIAAASGDTVIGQAAGAISGSTIGDALANFASRVQPGATRIIVNLGTNDAYHMAIDESGTSWRDSWASLWIKLQATGAQITVIGLLPTLHGMNCPWAYSDAYLLDYMDNISREACYTHGGIWVPLAGYPPQLIRPDGHPSPAGHAWIAGAIAARWNLP